MPRGRKRKFPVPARSENSIIDLTQDSPTQQQPASKVPKTTAKKSVPAPGPSTSKTFQVTESQLQQQPQSQSSSTSSAGKKIN